MALDNAQFISELSITDPPGTDAVAEGDDHIRTVKRATQQSFPNVDAAVPQTAAQMGQMAIKNEVNTFTQSNIFQNDIAFIIAATPFGLIWRDSSALRSWELKSADGGALEVNRYIANVFQEATVSIDNATGTITYDSLDNIFKQSATFQFVAQFNSTSARCRATNAGNETGLLYISDIATLRWSATMQSSADGNSYAINRHDSNGLFQNVPFRIAGNGNVVFQRDQQRISILKDLGTEIMQMGGLSDNAAFCQGRTGGGDVSFLLRADSGGQSFVLADITSGTPRFGVGTGTPSRTLHVVKPSASTDLTTVRFDNIPSSSAGLAAGDLFRLGNSLQIV